ncbi:MAG: DUF445 family protein [Candidatus Dadabacteria bacterium]|nr:MAG: DUF445 family protein [Candidatus Dadabacteria bacterium]
MSDEKRGSAWWYLIPAGIVAGSVTFSLIRGATKKKDTDGETDPHEHPEPHALVPPPPDVWAYLVRWSRIFSDAEDEVRALPQPDEAPVEAAAPPPHRLTPSNLTLGTLGIVTILTIWSGLSPSTPVEILQTIFLGALVGIGTNWVAIKMLFRPLEPRFGFQGVIPANRERIIDAISRGVAQNLLDRETIRRAVHESDIVRTSIDELIVGVKRLIESERFRGDITELIRDATIAFIRNAQYRSEVLSMLARVAELLPRQITMPRVLERALSNLFERLVRTRGEDIIAAIENNIQAAVRHAGDKIIEWLEQLPEGFEERRIEIEAALTDAIAHRAASFDIEGIVHDKLEAYTAEQLESLILSATDTHLAKIQYFGWILGALAAPAVAGIEQLVQWLLR